MIWGEYDVSAHGVISGFGFFVGTEEQYSKTKRPRPVQKFSQRP
jgi:allophanate hydrolase subunit 1